MPPVEEQMDDLREVWRVALHRPDDLLLLALAGRHAAEGALHRWVLFLPR
jgi:hypothetical protein